MIVRAAAADALVHVPRGEGELAAGAGSGSEAALVNRGSGESIESRSGA